MAQANASKATKATTKAATTTTPKATTKAKPAPKAGTIAAPAITTAMPKGKGGTLVQGAAGTLASITVPLAKGGTVGLPYTVPGTKGAATAYTVAGPVYHVGSNGAPLACTLHVSTAGVVTVVHSPGNVHTVRPWAPGMQHAKAGTIAVHALPTGTPVPAQTAKAPGRGAVPVHGTKGGTVAGITVPMVGGGTVTVPYNVPTGASMVNVGAATYWYGTNGTTMQGVLYHGTVTHNGKAVPAWCALQRTATGWLAKAWVQGMANANGAAHKAMHATMPTFTVVQHG